MSTLARNALALYGVQLAGYALPMVTMPYLSRALGPHAWGQVIFAQAFAAWVLLVVEYGFNLSATRDVARNRESKECVAGIVSSVTYARVLLSLAVLAVATAVIVSTPLLRRSGALLTWGCLLGVLQGMSPLWYFQGTERLGIPARMDILSRAIAAAGVLALVRSPGDGWIVLALQSLAALLSLLILHRWVAREVRLSRPPLCTAIDALRSGWTLFAYRVASSVYACSGPMLLGVLSSPVQVAYYGGADKFKSLQTAMLWPLWRAVYPRMSYYAKSDPQSGRVLRARIARIVISAAAAIALALWVCAPGLIRIVLGDQYSGGTAVMRVLVLSAVPVSVSGMLGIQWMLPDGMDRAFNLITVVAGVLFLLGAVTVAPRSGALGVAWLVVGVESGVALAMAAAIWIDARRRAHSASDSSRDARGSDTASAV